MAVLRKAPICPICKNPYDGIYANRGKDFVGDTFIMWDMERHICKSNESSVLSRYEERLERIVDTIRVLPTIEAIVLLKKYVQKLPTED